MLLTLGMVVVSLFAIAAVSVDLNRLLVVRSELLGAAHAGAHAGAIQLLPPNHPGFAADSAQSFAKRNLVMNDSVSVDSVELGHWNDAEKSFTPAARGANVIDAVSVVVSLPPSGSFRSLVGVRTPRLRARAIGWAAPAPAADTSATPQKAVLVW
jgi:hypothetical protein